MVLQIQVSPTQAGSFPVELTATNEVAPGDTQRFAITVIDNTSSEEEQVPATFAIESMYPNPFSFSITIQYTLPEAGVVRIVVFDVLGRQVALLQDAARAPGNHQLTWNPDPGITAGVYYIGIIADKGESLVREVVKQ